MDVHDDVPNATPSCSSYEADSTTKPITEDENFRNMTPVRHMIQYLVTSASLSIKNDHVNDQELRNKIRKTCDEYQQSPVKFLLHFGKYLCPNQLEYFKELQLPDEESKRELQERIDYLVRCYINTSKYPQLMNRRTKALKKLQKETDYFSEKQMMLRNPLLYEQLVGQYLTDDEIRQRDSVGSETLPESVNQENHMNADAVGQVNEEQSGESDTVSSARLDENQRILLREEFYQKMQSSFIEGRDAGIDYDSIDDNEEYDILQQFFPESEDESFDSESDEPEKLKENMDLV